MLSGCFNLKTEGNPPRTVEPPTAVYDVDEALGGPNYPPVVQEVFLGTIIAAGTADDITPPLRIEADCSGYIRFGKCSRGGAALNWRIVGNQRPRLYYWQYIADELWRRGQDTRARDPKKAVEYLDAASKIYQFFDWTDTGEFPQDYQSELGAVRNEAERPVRVQRNETTDAIDDAVSAVEEDAAEADAVEQANEAVQELNDEEVEFCELNPEAEQCL
jgi:hypothetical protein